MRTDIKKEEEVKEKSAINKSYRERLKTLRRGQEYYQANDIAKAVQCYAQYLNILAKFHDVPENKMAPKHFDQKKDLTELLVISHVYWDLAKAYDRSPKLQLEAVRCLDQFAKFSIGYKYQYINSQMVRTFIRKGLAYNTKAFKQTYDKVKVTRKGCYIATHLFGEQAYETNQLRKFRNEVLIGNLFGEYFINFYYKNSPKMVEFLEKNKFFNTVFSFICRPLIKFCIKLYNRE